jgi:ubiquinone/menaquinone biosynthesis C-methylase UbiE
VGLDLSRVSLGEARRDAGNDSRIHWIRANALELPFADRSFDFVIAAGSLHHTPDARAGFMEACRVLRPGGRCFVAVYHRKSYYFFVYYTLGWAARLCERRRLSALLINRGIILPLFLVYFLLGRLITHRQFKLPAYAELMNYFADQMLNPVVSFHSSEETSEWARVAGVERTDESYSHAGALLNMQFLRPV